MNIKVVTRIEDVREGDVATMRSESGTSVTGPVCRVDEGGSISIQLDDVVSQVFAPPTWQFVFATQDKSDG